MPFGSPPPAPPPPVYLPAARFAPLGSPRPRGAPWDPDPQVTWRPYGSPPGGPGPGGGQPPTSWEGFYFGGAFYRSWANINRTWNETDHWVAAGTSFGQDLTGWLASGMLGYNVQIDRMTLGIEASMLATKFTQSVLAPADSTVGSDPITADYKLKSFYMVAGRVGMPVADFLPYFKGGWALGEIETYTRDLMGSGALLHDATTSKFQNGPVVGFGVDYMATPNVIVGLSYDYVRFLDANHYVARVNDNGQALANPVHGSSDMNATFPAQAQAFSVPPSGVLAPSRPVASLYDNSTMTKGKPVEARGGIETRPAGAAPKPTPRRAVSNTRTSIAPYVRRASRPAASLPPGVIAPPAYRPGVSSGPVVPLPLQPQHTVSYTPPAPAAAQPASRGFIGSSGPAAPSGLGSLFNFNRTGVQAANSSDRRFTNRGLFTGSIGQPAQPAYPQAAPLPQGQPIY